MTSTPSCKQPLDSTDLALHPTSIRLQGKRRSEKGVSLVSCRLISRLMGILLDLLPLEETQSASKHRRSAGVASALAKQQPAGQAAADAAQARAAGSKTWTLQKALSDLGGQGTSL